MTDPIQMTRTISEVLDCELTQLEQLERGQQLAEAHAAVGRCEKDHAKLKATMKEQLESLEGECSRLAQIVRDGKEPRTVSVRIDYDDIKLMVHKIRLDTGELFATRPMTDEEKQRALPFASRRAN